MQSEGSTRSLAWSLQPWWPYPDLYGILAGCNPSGVAMLKVFINPLVLWLWIGGLVMVMGTIIALWPARAVARTGDRRAPVPVGTVSAPEESV